MIYYDKIIKVIDNFLPQDYVDDIEKLFLKPKEHESSKITWFYNDYTASKDTIHLKGINFYSSNYYSYQIKKIGLKILLRDGFKLSFTEEGKYHKR